MSARIRPSLLTYLCLSGFVLAHAACASNSTSGPADASNSDGSASDAGRDAGVTDGSDGPAPLASVVVAEDSLATSLRHTLADRTEVDLYLPEGVVTETVDTEIQLHALPAMSLPTGVVAAGVRLEPSGLSFRGPAYLSLRIPGDLTARRPMAFSVRDGKVTYQLVQVELDGSGANATTTIEIPLYGFSDHGLVLDVDPAIVAESNSINGAAKDRLDADLSVAADAAAARALLDAYFNREVKPKLEDAAVVTTQQSLDLAMRAYVGWRDLTYVVSAIYGESPTTIDQVLIEQLLQNAIIENMQYWNEQCVANLEPKDGLKAVQAWLWAPVVYLAETEGTRKSDLLDLLCFQMELVGTDLEAILDAEQAKALVLTSGLKVRGDTRTKFDPPNRVRVASVMGGAVSGAPATGDATGKVTLTAELASGDPAIAIHLTLNPVGSGNAIQRDVYVMRPARGRERELLSGRRFTGTQREYFVYGAAGGSDCPSPPDAGPCAGMSMCLIDQPHYGAEIVIAGNPFAYEVQHTDRHYMQPMGEPMPVPTDWVYHGVGTFSTVSSAIGFSYASNGVTTYATDSVTAANAIRSHSISLNISTVTQALTGRIQYPCHLLELEMTPAP
ncbi:hypothetical protein L6R52_10610 [Myxococcota bacterium]|nr:hypothetical protein [Myxococcota bacterium]